MNNVESFLLKNNIKYVLHEHQAVYTCDEAEKYCKNIPWISCKNLFLRNRRNTINYLLVIPSTKQLNIKEFAKDIEESKLSFSNDEILKNKLWLEPGSVSPFGIINNIDHDVVLYIDSAVYNSNIVSFHPNINTATLELEKEMFHKFLKTIENKVNIVNL